MKFVKQFAVAAALVGAALSVSAAPFNLVVNGDFENGGTDWDFGNNYATDASYFFAGGGAYSLFAGDSSVQSTTQTISTLAGQTYNFSFDVGNAAPNNSISAIFDGQTVYSVQNAAVDNGFHNQSFVVTATSASTVIDFQIGSSYITVVDNVSVTAAVPEPTTAALIALGLAGLAWRRARKV